MPLERPAPPTLLNFVRALIGPAFVIGGWQLIPTSYGWGVAIVYCGFAICLAEFVWEPMLLRKSYQYQVVLIAILVCLVDLFSLFVVFVPAPLNFQTLSTGINYAANGPGGIPWRPFYTEVVLIVSNPTDADYSGVEMLVRPDYAVAQIAQLSNLSDVSFEDQFGETARFTIEEVGVSPPIPLDFLATSAGYKVHCGHIPPHSSLRLVMALVEIKKSVPLQPGQPFNPKSLGEFSIDQTFTNQGGVFHYWFGSLKSVAIYAPKPTPTKINIAGTYAARYKTRSIDKVLDVADWKMK